MSINVYGTKVRHHLCITWIRVVRRMCVKCVDGRMYYKFEPSDTQPKSCGKNLAKVALAY